MKAPQWNVVVQRGAFGLYGGWLYELVAVGFFTIIGVVGAVFGIYSALGHPLAPGKQMSPLTLLVIVPFALYTTVNFLGTLAALLLPARKIEGVIEEAAVLTHEGARIATHLWHIAVSGNRYTFGRYDVIKGARTSLLAAGHAARLRVARDGQVLFLEVDANRDEKLHAHVHVTPPTVPSPLSASEHTRVERWAMRQVLLALALTAALVAAIVVFPETPLRIVFGVAGAATAFWAFGALRVRLALGQLAADAPTIFVEGKQRVTLGLFGRRAVAGVAVEDAAARSPSALAPRVRGRAIVLTTPGFASPRTTVVVEWLLDD